MATLRTYWKKRDFGKTAEPRGTAGRKKGFRYVIQKHDATRLHYDLRLELDGVMMSWAVTRGPSLVPGDKRLAIHVEDHPIEYNKFEGIIPKGQYGGGTVMVWDRGTWTPDHDPHKGMQKGHLDFELHGDKLKGHWHLVRMRKRPGERQEPWLLIKATDEFARKKSEPDVLEELSASVATGRTLDEIASQKKKVWHSNRSAKDQPKAVKPAPAKPVNRRTAPKRRTPRHKVAAKRNGKKRKIKDARKARLPDFIEPCLATLSTDAPATAGWVHEIKFDGYRIQARIAGDAVTLKTRTGLDWTRKFQAVEDACRALSGHDAILDGEIASVDENGVSNFSALQDDLKNDRQDRMIYYVFDLLHLDGQDLTGSPLTERKQALASLIDKLPKASAIRLSEHFEEDGQTMLKHACGLGLEGIVSKRASDPYRSGRSGAWFKTKCASNQELIVIGYEPSDKRGRLIRSLLLGYYEKGDLRYAGRIGTGWGQKEERDLQKRVEDFERKDTPLDKIPEEERRRGVQWLDPKLVVEVDFRGWTGGGLVRQGSLKGVREDKPAKQVVREVRQMPGQVKQAALRQKSPTKTTSRATTSKARSGKSQPVEVARVTLSHPDRVYWDDAGVTKQMLAQYYTQVWDWMAPHVTGRVLALVRCPDGASGQCFFQKHASAGIDTKHLVSVPDDGDKSIAVDSVEGVVSLAQAGVLEIHVRGSTTKHLEDADRLVFDLDPGPGVEWKDVIAAAREVRQRLRDLKLESFVKTTGGKGLHVVLPIKPTPWDDAKDFCRRVAEQMTADDPDRFTATIKKVARKNRIFIDYLRNSREATAIAPYSTRARPGATVSAPLTWEELSSQKVSNAFTVENLPKRLARMRHDPWDKISRVRQALPTKGRKS